MHERKVRDVRAPPVLNVYEVDANGALRSRGPNEGGVKAAANEVTPRGSSATGVERAAACDRDTHGQHSGQQRGNGIQSSDGMYDTRQNRAAGDTLSMSMDQQSYRRNTEKLDSSAPVEHAAQHSQYRSDCSTQSQQKKQQQQQGRYVVQSAYTQKNPFRKQTFEEFVYSPDYGAPANISVDIAKKYEPSVLHRTTNGDLHGRDLSLQPQQHLRSLNTSNISAAAIEALQTGDWFLKWTRRGRVHERYVWLDVQRGSLLWDRSANPMVMTLSYVYFGDIMSMHPDCITDNASQRTFYRMHIVAEQRIYVLATDSRDKFDIWFDTIHKLMELNGRKGIPNKLWSSTTGYANAVAATKWEARYSALHAIWKGYGAEMKPRVDNPDLIGSGAQGRVLPSD